MALRDRHLLDAVSEQPLIDPRNLETAGSKALPVVGSFSAARSCSLINTPLKGVHDCERISLSKHGPRGFLCRHWHVKRNGRVALFEPLEIRHMLAAFFSSDRTTFHRQPSVRRSTGVRLVSPPFLAFLYSLLTQGWTLPPHEDDPLRFFGPHTSAGYAEVPNSHLSWSLDRGTTRARSCFADGTIITVVHGTFI